MNRPLRLKRDEIDGHLALCPAELRNVMRSLRRLVLRLAPDVCEAIRYKTLSYYKPNQPYGAIGGNVCMIECRNGCVELSFIHGASLPDPEGLLRGTGKAKRRMTISSLADVRRTPVKALIRAASEFADQNVK